MRIAIGTLAIILSLLAGFQVIVSMGFATAVKLNANFMIYGVIFFLAYFIAAVCTFKASETAAYIFLLNGMLALNMLGHADFFLWACYSQLFFSFCLFIMHFNDKRKAKKLKKVAEN